METYNILTIVLCISMCLSWIRQSMTTDKINTLRDRLNRREEKPKAPTLTHRALFDSNTKLKSQLSIITDHFNFLVKVNTNLRADLETANKRNALQAESIEEFKKQVKGLEHHNENLKCNIAAADSEIQFLEGVRKAQAQTIKEYGEKYGYSEEARKPVPQGTEKDCPSCMGRGEVRRPYTEHEKDPCLDCEGLGRLIAVNNPIIGTAWYKKSSADIFNGKKDEELGTLVNEANVTQKPIMYSNDCDKCGGTGKLIFSDTDVAECDLCKGAGQKHPLKKNLPRE